MGDIMNDVLSVLRTSISQETPLQASLHIAKCHVTILKVTTNQPSVFSVVCYVLARVQFISKVKKNCLETNRADGILADCLEFK